MNTSQKNMMILVAGPFRSGTNDDPVLIHRNTELMEQYALRVYESGHLPVLGEWFALPLIRTAGSTVLGDDIFAALFHPVAMRLLDHCDAVLRVGGPSQGCDDMLRLAKEQGKPVYFAVEELPLVEE
jgi:GDP-mannose pyrophosphatase NudK